MQKYWKTSIFSLWLLFFIANVLSLPVDEVVEEVKDVIPPVDDAVVDGTLEAAADDPIDGLTDTDVSEVVGGLDGRIDPGHKGIPFLIPVANLLQGVGKLVTKSLF